MQLLVSVANSADASLALAGGADVIDAKDPLAGALGAVSANVLGEIHAVIAGRRLLTAALGDAIDDQLIEDAARTFSEAGAALVKVGFAGTTSAPRVTTLLRAAARGARRPTSGVVAVAYADADAVGSLAPQAIIELAAGAGATGVLLDTADKSGPGLRELITPTALAAWVADAHRAGLLVALAGKLTADDLAFVYDAGADIAGVRGAACDHGRSGRVSPERVRLLKTLCADAALSTIDRVAKR